MRRCTNCTLELDEEEVIWFLDKRAGENEWVEADLCSLECVQEFAWKLREREKKLSKSSVSNEMGGVDKHGGS